MELPQTAFVSVMPGGHRAAGSWVRWSGVWGGPFPPQELLGLADSLFCWRGEKKKKKARGSLKTRGLVPGQWGNFCGSAAAGMALVRAAGRTGDKDRFWLFSEPWQGDPHGWGVIAPLRGPLGGGRGVGGCDAAPAGAQSCSAAANGGWCRRAWLCAGGALQAAQVICMSAPCCCSRPEPCAGGAQLHGMLLLLCGGSGSAAAGGDAAASRRGAVATPARLSHVRGVEQDRGAAAEPPHRQGLHGAGGLWQAHLHGKVLHGMCKSQYGEGPK